MEMEKCSGVGCPICKEHSQETINQKYKENLNLTNEERAQRAEAALAAYPGGDPGDLSASIVDLVTDLMHLAHLNDIEPDYIAQMSAEHYTAEVEEEAVIGTVLHPAEVEEEAGIGTHRPKCTCSESCILCPIHGVEAVTGLPEEAGL